ncbi:hypothetical protein GCM10010517_78380 [Streptosporangium fragile]|uniref:Uncharacterized protein n=1 Tax=Streptosporangium fragile TaxID=46186 RepID=A0ABN3WE05_9ACTN
MVGVEDVLDDVFGRDPHVEREPRHDPVAFLEACQEIFQAGVARGIGQYEKPAGADRRTVAADPEPAGPVASQLHTMAMKRADNRIFAYFSAISEMSTSVRTCRIIYPQLTPGPYRDQPMAGDVERGYVVLEIRVERQLRPP